MDTTAVEQALHTLYHSPSTELKKEADKWLSQLYGKPEAWGIAWELLKPEKSTDVQFFGADLLRGKLKTSTSQDVSAEQLAGMRDNLLQLLGKAGAASKVMLTRACILLATYAIEAITVDVWNNVVAHTTQYLLETVAPVIGIPMAQSILLEFLSVLAEETTETRHVGERKTKLVTELRASIPQVLQLIDNGLQSGNPDVIIIALKCLSTWFAGTFGPSLDMIERHIALAIQITDASNADLFEAVVDMLVSLVGHPKSHDNPMTLKAMLPFLIQWHQNLFIPALNDENMDIAGGVTRVAVTLGETHMRMLLDAREEENINNLNGCLRLILDATGCKGSFPRDEKISDTTQRVWGFFIEELNDPKDQERAPELQQRYGDLLQILLKGALLKKLEYLPDGEDPFDSEERGEFQGYRVNVGENIASIAFLYPIICCEILIENLKMGITQSSWQQVEASLYGIRQATDGLLSKKEESPLKQIFQQGLLAMLPAHEKVYKAALLTIGSLADWISQNTDCLQPAVIYTLQALEHKDYLPYASKAMEELSHYCDELLPPFAPEITEKLTQTFLQFHSQIQNKDRLTLTRAMCNIMLLLPHAAINLQIERFLGPVIEYINSNVSAPGEAIQLVPYITIATVVCGKSTIPPDKLDPSVLHPVTAILNALRGAIHMLLMSTTKKEDRIAATCGLLEASLGEAFVFIFDMDLVEKLVSTFGATKHFAVVNLCSKILTYYGKDCSQQILEILSKLLFELSKVAISYFQTNLYDNPDLVREYFDLVRQIVRKQRIILLQNVELTNLILLVSVGALSCPEHPTFTSVTKCVGEIINLGKTEQILIELLVQHGRSLTDFVLRGAAGAVDRTLLSKLMGMLAQLNRTLPQHVPEWTKELLAQDGYPNERTSLKAKEAFLHHVTTDRSHRKTQHDKAIHRFADVSRGLVSD
eukprot:m.79262 g.79262  ORF g.79262 m.79262 type:complete len:934 (-) comp12706_c0_seq1:1507-4308(-)